MKLNLLKNIYAELYRIRAVEEAIAKKYDEELYILLALSLL